MKLSLPYQILVGITAYTCTVDTFGMSHSNVIHHHMMPVIRLLNLFHVSKTVMQHIVGNQIRNPGNVLSVCKAEKIPC